MNIVESFELRRLLYGCDPSARIRGDILVGMRVITFTTYPVVGSQG